MAKLFDLSAARAKRQQSTEDDADLEAFLADAEAEQKLPRERLSPEALGELRAALIPVMGGPGAVGRATVLHSVLYAMVRELLDQRANVATVRGAWEALQARRVPRAELRRLVGELPSMADFEYAPRALPVLSSSVEDTESAPYKPLYTPAAEAANRAESAALQSALASMRGIR